MLNWLPQRLRDTVSAVSPSVLQGLGRRPTWLWFASAVYLLASGRWFFLLLAIGQNGMEAEMLERNDGDPGALAGSTFIVLLCSLLGWMVFLVLRCWIEPGYLRLHAQLLAPTTPPEALRRRDLFRGAPLRTTARLFLWHAVIDTVTLLGPYLFVVPYVIAYAASSPDSPSGPGALQFLILAGAVGALAVASLYLVLVLQFGNRALVLEKRSWLGAAAETLALSHRHFLGVAPTLLLLWLVTWLPPVVTLVALMTVAHLNLIWLAVLTVPAVMLLLPPLATAIEQLGITQLYLYLHRVEVQGAPAGTEHDVTDPQQALPAFQQQ